MADDDHCTDFQFKSPFLPGESCEGIYNKNPESQTKPGYYWILSREYCGMTYTGSSCKEICGNYPETCDKPGYYRINDKWAYCDMKYIDAVDTGDFISMCAGVGGGWKRIVNIDINAGGDCPSGWLQGTHSGVSFCHKTDSRETCSSVSFSTNGTSYQKVCGRARGYQKGYTVGFAGYHIRNQDIDGWYADGLLITYGRPRQHIWSYVAGIFDNRTHIANCPCAVGGGRAAPPFVGTDYYCESGNTDKGHLPDYHLHDPLWDGSGCITSNCCDTPTQPWFYHKLSGMTKSNIEARICGYNHFSFGSLLIDQLQLYVQ